MKSLRVGIIVSFCISLYFLFDEIQFARLKGRNFAPRLTAKNEKSRLRWKEGINMLMDKMKSNENAVTGKKFFYINIWTSWCAPCLKEMPWLDSLASKVNEDVGCFFVSDLAEGEAAKCIKNRKLSIKNFHLLNDMGHFVSSICRINQCRNMKYPMEVILNREGEVLYISAGAYANIYEATDFVEKMNSLK